MLLLILYHFVILHTMKFNIWNVSLALGLNAFVKEVANLLQTFSTIMSFQNSIFGNTLKCYSLQCIHEWKYIHFYYLIYKENAITFFILKYFDIDEFILWMIIVSYKLWRKTAKINIRPKTICNPIFYRSQVKKRYFQMHPKNNIVFNLTPTKPDLKDKVLSPSVTLFTRQYKILFKMLFFTITMHVN